MNRWFFSYARSDAALALRFADGLIKAGADVWVDQYDIEPAQHWDRAVETAVREAAGLVVILSPRSVASANVADEISVALDAGKTVIPVRIEACTPPLRMTRMQFIDAEADFEAAVARCLSAMQGKGRVAAASAASAAGWTLASDDAARLTLALAQSFGPIAARLVEAEAKTADSAAAVRRALAARIPAEKDRAAFLKATAGLA